MRRLKVLVGIVLLAAAACSSKTTSTVTTPSATPQTTSQAPSSAPAMMPTAKMIAQPVIYGYYDGHFDTMLSTDVSSKTQAAAQHINYSAALVTRPASTFPSLYTVIGGVSKQPVVFGSEPGKSDYSPLWQEVNVSWKAGAKPVLLVKDDQIKALAAKGELTIAPTPVVLNCPIVKVSASSVAPTAKTIAQPVIYGYYDGHFDTMLSTDVSSKTQAQDQHINYSAALATRPASSFPSLYTVIGGVARQAVVFGSEPGQSDYSPLWQEVNVRWKAGAKPVLLLKDDQIKASAAKGELTIAPTAVVLNCPIVKMS